MAYIVFYVWTIAWWSPSVSADIMRAAAREGGGVGEEGGGVYRGTSLIRNPPPPRTTRGPQA